MNEQERAAMQQALEAMLNFPDDISDAMFESIRALRAALAQQPEPVCKCDLRTRLVGDGCEVCNPELAAEFAQQPEPAQEPYCYVYEYDSPLGMHRTLCPKAHNGKQPDRAIPLYTTPPQRPPLTDEEMRKLWSQYGYKSALCMRFARAIERKVRGEA